MRLKRLADDAPAASIEVARREVPVGTRTVVVAARRDVVGSLVWVSVRNADGAVVTRTWLRPEHVPGVADALRAVARKAR